MKKKLTDKQKLFLEAFKKHATNATKACESVGIDRQTYYNWKSANSAFKEACDNIHESMIDFAESMLYKNMKDGKETSILFFLKTRGKKRGFVEKSQIEYSGIDGGPIQTENKWTIEFVEAEDVKTTDTK